MSLKDPNVLNPNAKKRIAIVIANPAVSSTTGWPVGFWWSELTHPYHVFTEAGYEVDLFSPNGGPCEADAMSDPNDPSGSSKTDLISAAVLAYAKGADGKLIAKGKTVTGFANCEEDYADNAVWNYGLLPRDKHVMPWRIEDRLKAIGANYVQAGLWRSFAVRDGNLITGQQNFSGEETARLVVEALGR